MLRRRPRRIEVSLAGVTLLDTDGIGELQLCRADARQLGCRLGLTDPTPFVHQVLNVVGLLAAFDLSAPEPPG